MWSMRHAKAQQADPASCNGDQIKSAFLKKRIRCACLQAGSGVVRFIPSNSVLLTAGLGVSGHASHSVLHLTFMQSCAGSKSTLLKSVYDDLRSQTSVAAQSKVIDSSQPCPWIQVAAAHLQMHQVGFSSGQAILPSPSGSVPHQFFWPVSLQNEVPGSPIFAQTRCVSSWWHLPSLRVSPAQMLISPTLEVFAMCVLVINSEVGEPTTAAPTTEYRWVKQAHMNSRSLGTLMPDRGCVSIAMDLTIG